MLALEKSETHRGRCTPNVLPCRINHNGAVNTSKRYWNPITQPDGKNIAYFRGRKLHGKTLKVPEKYRGVVVSTSERILPKNEAVQVRGDVVDDGDGGDEEVEQDVKVMEEQASFEEIVVWGHEVLPDGMADPYVRGAEDWIVFAEQIHGYDVDEKKA